MSTSLNAANAVAIESLMIGVKELAAMIQRSTRSIWRDTSSGKLPKPVRLGGSARWRRKEIIAWIDAGCPSREKWEEMEGNKCLTVLVPISQVRAGSVNETLELSKLMAASGFFTDARDVAQAVVKVLAGQEMGFGPVSSMTGINIIKGRVSISANLMAAAVRRSRRYDYHVKHLDDQRCVIDFLMESKVIGTSAFSIDDAKKAGLTGDNWRKYPRNMLFAQSYEQRREVVLP